VQSRRVVILTYDFVPHAASIGACQRMLYLAHHLQSEGEDVELVVADGRFMGWFGLERIASRISVHRFRSCVNRVRGGRAGAATAEASAGNALRRFLGGIAKSLSKRVFPDYSIVDSIGIYRQLRARISTAGNCTLLISGPPHGLFLHVFWVKWFWPNVRVVLDYRDGWMSQRIFRPKTRFGVAVGRFLERALLQRADGVTYASPKFPALLRREIQFDLAHKGQLVMNGWVPEDECPDPISFDFDLDSVNVGYFGAASEDDRSYRDIGPLLTSVGASGSKVTLHCFGPIELKRSRSEYRNCVFHGNLSQQAAMDCMRRMDWLVVLHTDRETGEEPVPAKLFDYIRTKRPILCIWAGDGAAPEIVKDEGLGVVVDPRTPGALEGALAVIAESGSTDEWIFTCDDSAYSRRTQYQRMSTFLRTIGGHVK